MVIAVHDSKADWEQFRDNELVPKMQAGIEGGFTTPPEETGIELVRLQP